MEFIIIPIILWQAFVTQTIKIIVTNNSLLKSQKHPLRNYELKFNEIATIVDDSIWILPGIKGFVFHLIPKEGIKKNFIRFTVTAGYERPLEILETVLSKVDKGTDVDASLIKRLEKWQQETQSRK